MSEEVIWDCPKCGGSYVGTQLQIDREKIYHKRFCDAETEEWGEIGE